MSFLRDTLNVYGLDQHELAILAAMVIHQPVLFAGMHGSCKTELPARLAAAYFGVELLAQRFRAYEAKNVDIVEALGYPDAHALRHARHGKEIGYVPSPISMLTRWVVLIDEILVASSTMQNRLLELIRARTLMGIPTEVRYIFGATNPPTAGNHNLYDVSPGSLQLIDRFLVINLPSLSVHTDEQRKLYRRMLQDSELRLAPGERPLRKLLRNARTRMAEFKSGDRERVENVVVELVATLTRVEGGRAVKEGQPLTTFSPRKAKVLTQFLLATEALRRTAPQVPYSLTNVVTGVLGLVPEATLLCRTKLTTGDKLRVEIEEQLRGLHLQDPLRAHRGDLLKLARAKVADDMAWSTEIISAASSVTDVETLARAVVLVERRGAAGKMVGRDLRQLLARVVLPGKAAFSLTRLTDAVETAIAAARRAQ
jgi:MoxR-like ATPase